MENKGEAIRAAAELLAASGVALIGVYEMRYAITEKGRAALNKRPARHVFTEEERRRGGKARAALPDWPDCQRKGWEQLVYDAGPEFARRIIGRSINKRKAGR